MKLTLFPKTKRSRGFTLLLAALVASIALALGSAIYSIVSKELELSSIGQDSQYSFYAADTAAECALFWDSRADLNQNTFATSSIDTNPNDAAIKCDNVAATNIQVTSDANDATTTYEIDSLFEDVTPGGYCAYVQVAKSYNSTENAENTFITADGYNVGCTAINTAPDALERTVELQY
jgi:hypothetical protein